MKGYKNYDNVNFNKIFTEYQNTKITQKELCEKNNIPLTTFNTRYMKYKLMNGGNLRVQNENEKPNSIFKKQKETSEQNKNAMEVMYDVGKRGGKNKHSGFTDIIEEQNKKDKEKQSNKKVVDLEEMYGTTKFLNEIDKKIGKA